MFLLNISTTIFKTSYLFSFCFVCLVYSNSKDFGSEIQSNLIYLIISIFILKYYLVSEKNYKEYKKLNNDIKMAIINESIKQLKNNYYDLRSRKVINLIKSLNKRNFKNTTLGGCIFNKKGTNLSLILEKV